MEIKLKIKNPSLYDYDDILDKYNETKDSKFLFYCFIKKNNLNIGDIIELTNSRYDKVFTMIYNIQRELENKKPIKDFEELNLIIDGTDFGFEDNDNIDENNIDDFFDDDKEDF
jgi:hypothetical protein